MKRETLFLKITVFLIGTPVLAMCVLGLPLMAKSAAENNPEFAKLLYPILIAMYIAAIPFFIALFQSLKLLTYIDKGHAFSMLSVKALQNIKYCAFTISTVYVLDMPFFYILAEIDDAPGVIIIGLVFIFASLVIAFFATLLQKLLKDAVEIKSENELTV